MDESWRISIGSIVPRWRSAEESRRRRRAEPPAVPALEPEDFRDVFGGPPRSVLLRKFSGDLTDAFAASEHRPAPSTSSFYDEVFRPVTATHRARGLPPEGRRLPAFLIPVPERRGLVRTEVGFYNDIFGSDGGGGGGGDRRSRSRSKSARSKSSSAISMDDVSPPARPWAMDEDAVFSSLASKLRPITIPSRHGTSSPPWSISVEEENSHRTLGTIRHARQKQQQYSGGRFTDSKDGKGDRSSINSRSSSSDQQTSSELLHQRSHAGGGGFSCCFLLPETMSLETSFRKNHKEPTISFCNSDDDESHSSAISSVYHDPSTSKVIDAEAAAAAAMETEREEMEEEEDEDQAIASSYVIKIGDVQEKRAGAEGAAGAVDEAIAWAKEKFLSHQMLAKGAIDQNHQIHDDEEMFYSIEDKDGFRDQRSLVCIQFGED